MQSMHFCVSRYIPVFLPLTLSECLALALRSSQDGRRPTSEQVQAEAYAVGPGPLDGAGASATAYVGTSHPAFLAPVLTTVCTLWLEREKVRKPSLPSKELCCAGLMELVYDQPGCPGLLGGCFFPQDWEPGSAPWSGHSLPNSTSAVLTGLPRTVPQRRPHAAV